MNKYMLALLVLVLVVAGVAIGCSSGGGDDTDEQVPDAILWKGTQKFNNVEVRSTLTVKSGATLTCEDGATLTLNDPTSVGTHTFTGTIYLNQSGTPNGPAEGQLYYNSSVNALFIHNGTTWSACNTY